MYVEKDKLCCGDNLVSYKQLQELQYKDPVCVNNEIVNGSGSTSATANALCLQLENRAFSSSLTVNTYLDDILVQAI